MRVMGEMDQITQSCFVMDIRASVRHILGNTNEAPGRGGKGQALTSRDFSSLVIDTLCDQARGQNIAVACFYVGLAAQEERSSTSMLGALLKQLVVGLKEVPGEIVEAYEEQKNFIGGRRPQHTDIVKMLQTASSKKRTFICIDALDECDRAKVLDSLSEILHESPTTKIFVTGRPHIRPEIARRLTGRAASLSLSTKRDDIIRYLCARLKDDTAPDAMNSSLETEILGKVPEDFSEMYVEIATL